MRGKKRIVIAEDHKLLREGLKSVLTDDDSFDVVGLAKDGIEAVRFAKEYNPDLVMMDLNMPRMSGIPAMRRIRRRFPNMKLLVLTVSESEDDIFQSFKAGANGYCLKNLSAIEIRTAVNSVLQGKLYLCPQISEKLLKFFMDAKQAQET